jgi:diaphanous 1
VLMIGNTLNGGTFRGDARGFQLDTLIKVSRTSLQVDGTEPQLRDTRTGKGATCPTLLHYLAKVLLRTDPRLVLFHEDLFSLEAVARRKSLVPCWVMLINSKRSRCHSFRQFPNNSPEDSYRRTQSPANRRSTHSPPPIFYYKDNASD